MLGRMPPAHSRLFGDLDVDGSDSLYVVRRTTVSGVTRDRGLYVSDEVLSDDAAFAAALARLDDTDALDARARAAIAATFTDPDDGTVRDFLDFHLEELEPEVLARLVGVEVPPDRATLLASIALLGFAIHPRANGAEIVVDYGVGRDVSDQVLAVAFEPSGAVRRVSHES